MEVSHPIGGGSTSGGAGNIPLFFIPCLQRTKI